MRFLPLILAMLAVLSMGGQAAAQNADYMLKLAYSTFLDRPGWQHFDVAKLAADARAKLNPGATDDGMSPIEKALFYVDMMEPPLKQSRTLLRFGQITTEGPNGPVPAQFIEVDRYNLGMTGDPHVAWRFHFLPGEGSVVEVRNALRQVISPEDAAASNCLVAACLDTDVSTNGSFAWADAQAPAGGWTAPFPGQGADGHAVSAQAAAEMSVALNIASVEGDQYRWRGPEQPEAIKDGRPFLFFLDDRSIGEDGLNDAIMGIIRLNDHALAEMWTRRMESGTSVDWKNAVVTRPSPP